MRQARLAALVVLACLGVSGADVYRASGAGAGAGAPALTITTYAQPTVFSTEHNGSALPDGYVVAVTNTGGVPITEAQARASPVVISDVLPVAVSARSVSGTIASSHEPLVCTEERKLSEEAACRYEGVLQPGDSLLVQIEVVVSPGAPSGAITNSAAVSGGGAPAVSTSETNRIGSSAESLDVPYGFSNIAAQVTSADGRDDTQAGSHPYQMSISYFLNTIANATGGEYESAGGFSGSPGAPKDVVVDLPAGFLGNPGAIEKCPQYDVPSNTCPASTQIGAATITFNAGPGNEFYNVHTEPIYNVVPPAGYPAAFAFEFDKVAVLLYATVTPATNYAVRVVAKDIPASIGLLGFSATFFGTPLANRDYRNTNKGLSEGAVPQAFLEDPTSCSPEPQDVHVYSDSWQQPGRMLSADSPDLGGPSWARGQTTLFPQLTGCDLLQFTPSLEVRSDTTRADEPSGTTVNLELPQAPFVEQALSSPSLKEATVTLPSGVSISPSGADGLEGCAPSQLELMSALPGHCPDGSRLGTAKVTTPLLSEPLEGAVFLETPHCNPCSTADAADGSMVRLYLEVAGSGVVIKKEGVVHINPTTGQLTTTFADLPQEPASHVELHFKGGLRAALATPQRCGAYVSTSDLVPWSAPATPDATPFSQFDVSWDGNGGTCPSSNPFSPLFEAGTSNPNAGRYSPMTVTLKREDREQDIAAIQVRMPPGLIGSLKGVPLCGEPRADLGTCSAASEIGTMNVAAGAGGHPFYAKGQIYLTGPYKNAPFGLSIVTPTVAGPFNLGKVVVRAKINIDPRTAALTTTTDPLPQVIDGVPLRLRLANVTVDRSDFILNPTDCAQQHITATVTGAQGAVSHEQVPFAVSGCAGLRFGPKFSVSTSGRTSRANGASLDARLTFPLGAQSNIAKVKVDLPKQLPSRLSTLQHACLDGIFNSNPAACPPASLVGAVRVVTPVLPLQSFQPRCSPKSRCARVSPASLVGPVYFVSHGGAKFPDLVAVLEGYGVRVDLIGETSISLNGITSSMFRSVPDVPVSSFDLFLPQGPQSALAALGSLCKAKLSMSTSFIAQDGVRSKQNTKITVTGCPKAMKKPRKATKAGSPYHSGVSNGKAKR